ncbi:hypothetical protein CAEBREN_01063 [Caenorhabditis brenneri]|uniref:Uncharacterized protein n=1 Tax=Caenorhabditis brenneri TaxID=135651 RepID=G0NXG2_CAEBE|nr:hypothetical protein CAEBREN_01063 [Caenorhabditis brenneri]
MPMSEEDQNKLKEGTKKGIDILNGVSTIGKESLEFLKNEKVQTRMKGSLGVIGGLGDIIKGVIKFTGGGSENPLVKQMQEMADKIELLGDKVSTNFDEMKALITEVNFFVKVLSPTYNLTRFMRDCFKHCGSDANKNFLKYYERNPPLKLAFMIIEAFAAGLQGHKEDLLNIGFLFKVTIKIFDKVHKWKQEYTEGQTGEDEAKNWKDVSKFVEELPKQHPNLTNRQVADKVEKKLNSYFWSFPMYLIVFDKSEEDVDYHYNVSSQYTFGGVNPSIIKSWEMKDWNGCNIIIYRSLNATGGSEDDYEKIKKEVKDCKTGKLSYDGSVKDIIENQLVEKRYLSPYYSFGALISDGTHPIIRAVNSDGHRWGPGWWEKANVKDVRDGKKNNTLHFFLIVSF